jgi:glutamate-1-semialdehyde 2,1-aminomutase
MLQYIAGHPELYEVLDNTTAQIVAAVPEGCTVNRAGSMFTIFFQSDAVRNYEDAKRSDAARFGRFFHELLERGVYFPPSQFEAAFVSTVHTPEDVTFTRNALAEALAAAQA